jgi:hypothetical protein
LALDKCIYHNLEPFKIPFQGQSYQVRETSLLTITMNLTVIPYRINLSSLVNAEECQPFRWKLEELKVFFAEWTLEISQINFVKRLCLPLLSICIIHSWEGIEFKMMWAAR